MTRDEARDLIARVVDDTHLPATWVRWEPETDRLCVTFVGPHAHKLEVRLWDYWSTEPDEQAPYEAIEQADSIADAEAVVVRWVFLHWVRTHVHDLADQFRFRGVAVFNPHVVNPRVEVTFPPILVTAEMEATMREAWGLDSCPTPSSATEEVSGT